MPRGLWQPRTSDTIRIRSERGKGGDDDDEGWGWWCGRRGRSRLSPPPPEGPFYIGGKGDATATSTSSSLMNDQILRIGTSCSLLASPALFRLLPREMTTNTMATMIAGRTGSATETTMSETTTMAGRREIGRGGRGQQLELQQ